MAGQQIEQTFKSVVDCAWQLLKAHRFRKQGQRFRRRYAKTVGIIEFQKSQTGGAHVIKFTMNLGIVSITLAGRLDPEDDVDKAIVATAHIRQRIGALLPTGQDVWWEVTDETDTAALAAEIASVIENQALPFIDAVSGDDHFVSLWQSGRSPGLTERQRERFLAALSP